MTKNILIIEDEKPLAKAMELKLKKAGHNVQVFYDGQGGLDAAAKQKFDVVLLDLIMPVLDGFQVLEKLNSMSYKPSIFVLSNLSQIEDEQRAIKLGAKKYLVKSDTPLTTIVDYVNNTAT
ncbi:MAG: response regulator [Candidatus Woesebacteria bacterium]|jgi:DNA-binding response OmpR family regulator